MTQVVLQFLGSALVIMIAGTFLTRFADAIADITGLGRLLVGSILLAGATSLPELAVDLNAVRLGATDMAVGDLMGSSLFNLLILGMLDLSRRSSGRLLPRGSTTHSLSATHSIVLTSIAAMSIVAGRRGGTMFAGLGAGSWALLVAYVLGVRMSYEDQRAAARSSEAHQDVLIPAGRLKLASALGGFAACTVVILFTAPMLAQSAAQIADYTGLGGTFIGTTLVALCTSLPELVASMAALRMGAFDLAVGNVFGSNSFNMVLLIALDLAQAGPLFSSISSTHAVTGMASILITAVAIMGQVYRVEKRVAMAEPGASLVIGLVIAALALIYHIG